MSRLDYRSMLDANVNVDVDAEFDNPTILDHDHDIDDSQTHEGLASLLPSQSQLSHLDAQIHRPNSVGILDHEHDESPFMIIPDDQPSNDDNLRQDAPVNLNDDANANAHANIDVSSHQIDPQVAIELESEPPIEARTPKPTQPESSTPAPEVQVSKRDRRTFRGSNGGMSLKGMTDAEKRERQKLQNKQAAERSRHKRKAEQLALEQQVEDMQSENAQLRLRLQTLLASKSLSSPAEGGNDGTSPPSSTSPTNDAVEVAAQPITVDEPSDAVEITGTGIDYNYIDKLTNELYNTKRILMERNITLAELKKGTSTPLSSGKEDTAQQDGGDEGDDEHLKEARDEFLKKFSTLQSAKAERSSLHTILDHLKGEIESLRRQARGVREKLDEKKSVIPSPFSHRPQTQHPLTGPSGFSNSTIQNPDGQASMATVTSTATAPALTTHNDNNTDRDTEENVVPQESQEAQLQPEKSVNPEDAEAQDASTLDQDRALDDIRGWINAAVSDWDKHVSTSTVGHLKDPGGERDGENPHPGSL
ncbi:uncharacterized protein I303_100770 [Kwoniella dejecticola CBS 10117]|uniref:BZIP domain-containing protein n=1 Tax=Kwoniella dejecticola CBS 10117 TaxID=1296121 RepID=A0A1A6AFU8_9TREE|nr:uncharacterized protein I303_00772 [Kwoniella dejecticola CBS 10117]OBR88952.1 hypothetical protein I303_00772 [Kwoniella dejecticola CBS 10117]